MDVAVVHPDEWVRRGWVSGLSELGVKARSWPSLSRPAEAEYRPEVVFVHIGDGPGWDRYSTISEVQASGLTDGSARVVAVVPALSNPLLRLRLQEAGVREAVMPVDLADMDGLRRALESEAASPSLLPAELRAFGLKPTAALNDCLAWVQGSEAAAVVDGELDLSRRRLISLRTRIASMLQMEPWAAGSGAIVERRVPSWRQVIAVLNMARGAPTASAELLERLGVVTVARGARATAGLPA